MPWAIMPDPFRAHFYILIQAPFDTDPEFCMSSETISSASIHRGDLAIPKGQKSGMDG